MGPRGLARARDEVPDVEPKHEARAAAPVAAHPVDRDALVVAGDREGGVVGAVEAAITQISDSFEEFEHLSTTILPLPYAQRIRSPG